MNKAIKAAGISSIILLLILLNTDPQRLPSVALVAPFILMFIAFASIIYYSLGFMGLLSAGSRFKAGLAGGAMPVILMVLQSLGQLTIRDTLVIFALFALVYFYMSRLGVKPAS